MDEGAYADLNVQHCSLDEAVAAAYVWPKVVAQDDDEVFRRLADLNAEIAAGRRPYSPFPELPRRDGQLSIMEGVKAR